MIVHFPVKYVTQKMCDKAVDISLGILKMIPNWFVTKKWLKSSLLLFTQIKGYLRYKTILMKILTDVVFNRNEVSILNIDINNINLGNNFDEDDSDTNILIRLSAWHINLKNLRHLQVTSATKLFFVIKQRLTCN